MTHDHDGPRQPARHATSDRALSSPSASTSGSTSGGDATSDREPASSTGVAIGRLADLLDEAVRLGGEAREAMLAALPPQESAAVRDLLAELPDAEATAVDDGATHDPYLGEPRSGELVGGCRLGEVIGRGGVGTVFAADQIQPPRPVAVKVLRAASARASHLRRFRTEAAALARLVHPAIARIYAAGVTSREGGEVPYLVMERVDGARSFVEWAASVGRDPRRVVRCMLEVVEGMRHGHRRGVLHRDLKPSNVLVGGDGHARVIDFGVARFFGDDVARDDTVAGALIGTPAYMAPEQFTMQPAEIDTRVDVHALGVILYEALSGERPYDIPRHLSFDAARIVRDTEVPPLDGRAPRVGRDLSAIVAKAMAKDRERRYGGMEALADDLRAYLASRAVSARPETTGERFARWLERNPQWAAAAAVTLLGLGIALFIGWRSWSTANARLSLAYLQHAMAAADARSMELARRFIARAGEVDDPRLAGWALAGADAGVTTLARTPGGNMMCGALSPDGTRWIGCGDGPTVHVVDLATRVVRSTNLPEGVSMVWAACATPDGRIFLGADTGLFELFEDGTAVQRATQPIGQGRNLTLVEGDGLYLLAASMQLQRYDLDDWSVEVWNLSPGGISIGGLATDGRGRFFVACADGRQRAFDLVVETAAAQESQGGPSARLRRTPVEDRDFRMPPRRGAANAVAIHPSGHLVAFGMGWGEVLLVDARTGALVDSVPTIHGLWSLAFDARGETLVAGDRGGRVHRIALHELAEEGSRAANGERLVASVETSAAGSKEPAWGVGVLDGGRIVANIGFEARLLDTSASWAFEPPPAPGGRLFGASDFDGRRVRAVALDGSVAELDCAKGAWQPILAASGESILVGAVSPDGRWAARVTMGNIEILSLPERSATAEAAASVASVAIPGADRVRLAWSAESDRLAVAVAGEVRVLSTTGEELLREPEGTAGAINQIVWFAPDRFATIASSGGVKATEHVVGGTRGEDRVGVRLPTCYTPTYSRGRWLLGTFAGPVLMSERGSFEALMGIERAKTEFIGHDDAVHTSAISPDGTLLATGGADGRVILWRVADGETVLTFLPMGEQVFFLRWSEDGRSILAFGARGGVRLIDSVPRSERLAALEEERLASLEEERLASLEEDLGAGE